MGKILDLLIDNYTFTFVGITLISFVYKTLYTGIAPLEAFLISFLTWSVGIRGLIAFIANWVPVFADQIAEKYGWPIGSSFQREIASAEGAFGTLGILCNWISGDFWTATIIGVSFCWFFSEIKALWTIFQRKKDPNYRMNSALQIGMRIDLLSSIILFLCLLAWKFDN